jgi:hypothetical protein
MRLCQVEIVTQWNEPMKVKCVQDQFYIIILRNLSISSRAFCIFVIIFDFWDNLEKMRTLHHMKSEPEYAFPNFLKNH